MKFRLKLVKVESEICETPIAQWDINKIEIKGKSLKVKFLPPYSLIKDAIRNYVFQFYGDEK